MSSAFGRCAVLFAAFLVASCDIDNRTEQPSGSVLAFDNAWVRPLVAGGVTTAAYCDITNRSHESVFIKGFTSEDPDVRVELHETSEEGGIIRMRPLQGVTIPSDETVSFIPGGKHLMLFGIDGTASEVKLNAMLDDGQTLSVVFTTRLGADQ